MAQILDTWEVIIETYNGIVNVINFVWKSGAKILSILGFSTVYAYNGIKYGFNDGRQIRVKPLLRKRVAVTPEVIMSIEDVSIPQPKTTLNIQDSPKVMMVTDIESGSSLQEENNNHPQEIVEDGEQ